MAEGSERTQATFMYTYTYDQFTVFFYGDHVFIGGKEYPIGQCCVDVMNLDEAVLKKIARRIKVCISAAVDLLTKKRDSAAAFAQERLNAVWDIVFTLPVYRDLNMDEWNAAVAAAQDLVARSERGELTDEELKRRLAEL